MAVQVFMGFDLDKENLMGRTYDNANSWLIEKGNLYIKNGTKTCAVFPKGNWTGVEILD